MLASTNLFTGSLENALWLDSNDTNRRASAGPFVCPLDNAMEVDEDSINVPTFSTQDGSLKAQTANVVPSPEDNVPTNVGDVSMSFTATSMSIRRVFGRFLVSFAHGM